MPTYEYACTACGERTEAKQSFDDPPLEKCPACGGKLRRLYSPVGIVFKGSGFYSTDTKKAASKSTSSEGKPETSKSSTPAGGDAKKDSTSGSDKKPSSEKSA